MILSSKHFANAAGPSFIDLPARLLQHSETSGGRVKTFTPVYGGTGVLCVMNYLIGAVQGLVNDGVV